jgi:hypothetical protein
METRPQAGAALILNTIRFGIDSGDERMEYLLGLAKETA